MQVFDDVVRKNWLIRTALFCYASAPVFIKSYLLILYGLKCYLSARSSGSAEADILFFAVTPNEKGALASVRRHLFGLSAGDLRLARSHCLRPAALLALPAFLLRLPRLYRFARRLSGALHFMPACRVFSTLAYYLRFRQMVRRSGARAVFIANHYSPESIALAVAAHAAERKVFCTNHANGTWYQGYVPPLYCDLVAATSGAILEAYAKASRQRLNAVYLPQGLPQAPMRSDPGAGGPMTVGIFLTALTDRARLRVLVRDLADDPAVEKVLIRSHPMQVINEDLTEFTAGDARVAETSDLPLADNVALCDLAVCGNSSAAVDVLRGGVPVLYDGGLDGLPRDFNGYLARGLVMPLPSALDAAAMAAVRAFYGSPDWIRTMRHFDAGYRRDGMAMYQVLNEAVRRLIGTTEEVEVRYPATEPALGAVFRPAVR
jgi:hypothetical protein